MPAKIFWGLFFSTLLHFAAFVDLSRSELRATMLRVQQRSFPELDGARFELGSFDEADSFFQSHFDWLSLLTPHPLYRIEVNPRLLAQPCPPNALEAVLAHELSHTLDYQRGGVGGVLGIALQLLFATPSYEHRTDLQAIFRGYGPGLIRYRQCIYALLDPEQRARKRTIYYTPEQIELILQRLNGLSFAERSALRQKWLEHPPLTDAEIQEP